MVKISIREIEKIIDGGSFETSIFVIHGVYICN